MHQEKKIKFLLGLLYLSILISFLFILFSNFDLEEISTYEFIQKNKDQLNLLKQNKLIFLILIFFVFTIFWVSLLGFGSPIALLGGFIFGKWIGSLLVVFSLTTGSLCLYLIGKYFFYKFLNKKLHNKFNYLEKIFSKNELLIMIVFRFVGLVPFFIANLLPVIFGVSIKNYYLGTLIGIFPAIFIMVSLGSGLSNVINTSEAMPSFLSLIMLPEIYFPIIGFLIIVVLSIFLKKFLNKKQN
tara:strand:- start:74 stop:799 length:726 start_codon:yes stop_codon:yes gene_type:complete